MKKFNLIACGGTFDHFHKGHQEFLNLAFSKAEKVVIGLTSEEYVKKQKENQDIEPYSTRKRSLKEFLQKKGFLKKARIITINDHFGPTLEKKILFDAILVSEESTKGAIEINCKRKDLGLSELQMITQPIVLTQDNNIISSTRVRNGQIDRNGKQYLNPTWLFQKISITSKIRKELKSPFGVILKNIDLLDINPQKTITVGDFVTKYFNEHQIKQRISVIDFTIAREKMFSEITQLGFKGSEKTLKINNPAGILTPLIFKLFYNLFQQNFDKRTVIVVNGEEDLAVLPILITCPLGFDIYYGQPGEGMVKVKVNEENKKRAYSITNSFKRS